MKKTKKSKKALGKQYKKEEKIIFHVFLNKSNKKNIFGIYLIKLISPWKIVSEILMRSGKKRKLVLTFNVPNGYFKIWHGKTHKTNHKNVRHAFPQGAKIGFDVLVLETKVKIHFCFFFQGTDKKLKNRASTFWFWNQKCFLFFLFRGGAGSRGWLSYMALVGGSRGGALAVASRDDEMSDEVPGRIVRRKARRNV